MRCFACGRVVEMASGERIAFRDGCPCGADLHVCRNCHHHDVTAHHECRETEAEPVRDRTRANRCEWFRPADGDAGPGGAREQARAELDRLFRK